MIEPTWATDDGRVKLYLGDSIELLPEFEQNSIDCIVTDPPYMIGAISTGSERSKSGTWIDMVNSAHWFKEWMLSAKVALRSTGYLAACCNWRTIPTMICALSKASWSATSCVVWDKQWIGTAYKNAFRPTYELAIVAAMPEAEIPNRSASDLFRGEKWQASQCGDTSHAAEKPVDFMEYLVENLSPRDGVVCDPFMGSATTCIAAVRTGRSFVGIEGDDRHWPELTARIEAELERAPLFEAKPKYVTRSMLE